MKSKKRKTSSNSFTVKDYFYLTFLVVGLSYFIYKVAWNATNRHMLDKGKNVKIRAVVIDEENAQNSSPVGASDWANSYIYAVNGKSYK